jgi:hypothetical protein
MQKVSKKRRTFYPPPTAEQYREALRQWMQNDYPVTLDFAFRSKRDPNVLENHLMEWFKPTIERADETL